MTNWHLLLNGPSYYVCLFTPRCQHTTTSRRRSVWYLDKCTTDPRLAKIPFQCLVDLGQPRVWTSLRVCDKSTSCVPSAFVMGHYTLRIANIGQNEDDNYKKTPKEMEVAPPYTLLTLLAWVKHIIRWICETSSCFCAGLKSRSRTLNCV